VVFVRSENGVDKVKIRLTFCEDEYDYQSVSTPPVERFEGYYVIKIPLRIRGQKSANQSDSNPYPCTTNSIATSDLPPANDDINDQWHHKNDADAAHRFMTN
jgi:hypothetical protein